MTTAASAPNSASSSGPRFDGAAASSSTSSLTRSSSRPVLTIADPLLRDLVETELRKTRPTAEINPREWAAAHRILLPPSPFPGRWRDERTPYLREPLETIADPRVHTVVMETSTQVGKTEFLLNAIGYYMHAEPCPILVVLPSIPLAEEWSRERLGAMCEATPVLRGLLHDEQVEDNRLKVKAFPGGRVILVGANAPGDLASRTIRILIVEEVDKIKPSAGREGDPIKLGERRQAWFRGSLKRLYVSSPTIAGLSRIHREFEESDRRYYRVPCMHCGLFVRCTWRPLAEDAITKGPTAGVVYTDNDPTTAHLTCGHCACDWSERQRILAGQHGEWIATAPFRGRAGFHLSELYSPLADLEGMVRDWLEAQQSVAAGDIEPLKVFINTRLGEVFEDRKRGKIPATRIALRAAGEASPGEHAPSGVVLVTAGIDVQPDRIELEAVGWGLGLESWSLDWKRFDGDVTTTSPWRALDAYLLAQHWTTADGLPHYIRAACLDTGHEADLCYAWARSRWKRRTADRAVQRILAVKGKEGDRQVWPREASSAKGARAAGCQLFVVGVDTAKTRIHNMLRIAEPGPGYCHFPPDRPEEYFAQLTAEKPILERRGRVTRERWVKDPPHARNEAFDLRVYAFTALRALEQLFRVNLERHAATLRRRAAELGERGPAPRRPVQTSGHPGAAGRRITGRRFRS